MNFEEVGALVDALNGDHPAAFERIGPHLIGVLWDGTSLVITVDRDLETTPLLLLPETYRGYPVRVERVGRPRPQ